MTQVYLSGVNPQGFGFGMPFDSYSADAYMDALKSQGYTQLSANPITTQSTQELVASVPFGTGSPVNQVVQQPVNSEVLPFVKPDSPVLPQINSHPSDDVGDGGLGGVGILAGLALLAACVCKR